MRGLAVRQGNKDSAGLVFTNKVSIENKEFRDPLLVLGRGERNSRHPTNNQTKESAFYAKKKQGSRRKNSLWQTAQLTGTLTKRNSMANEAWERISICHTSCYLHDEG